MNGTRDPASCIDPEILAHYTSPTVVEYSLREVIGPLLSDRNYPTASNLHLLFLAYPGELSNTAPFLFSVGCSNIHSKTANRLKQERRPSPSVSVKKVRYRKCDT